RRLAVAPKLSAKTLMATIPTSNTVSRPIQSRPRVRRTKIPVSATPETAAAVLPNAYGTNRAARAGCLRRAGRRTRAGARTGAGRRTGARLGRRAGAGAARALAPRAPEVAALIAAPPLAPAVQSACARRAAGPRPPADWRRARPRRGRPGVGRPAPPPALAR